MGDNPLADLRVRGGKACRIVDAILEDMRSRRGFRQNWEAIDQDIRDEIVAEWRGIVLDELGR